MTNIGKTMGLKCAAIETLTTAQWRLSLASKNLPINSIKWVMS